MKLYLEYKTTKLKIVGRRNDGRIVLEIVEEKLKSLIGELVTHTEDDVIGWILLGCYEFYAEYEDHIFLIPNREIQQFFNKVS